MWGQDSIRSSEVHRAGMMNCGYPSRGHAVAMAPATSLVAEYSSVLKVFVDPVILPVLVLAAAWVIINDGTGLGLLIVSDAPLLLAFMLIAGGVVKNAEREKQRRWMAAEQAQQRHHYQHQHHCCPMPQQGSHCSHQSPMLMHPASHYHNLKVPTSSSVSTSSTRAPRSPSSKSNASSSNISFGSNNSKKKKLTAAEKTEACVRFNHGKCNALASGCKFGHFCMLCGMGHMHAARGENCPFRERSSSCASAVSTPTPSGDAKAETHECK